MVPVPQFKERLAQVCREIKDIPLAAGASGIYIPLTEAGRAEYIAVLKVMSCLNWSVILSLRRISARSTPSPPVRRVRRSFAGSG